MPRRAGRQRRRLTGRDSAEWIYMAVSALDAVIYDSIGRAIVSRQPAKTMWWLLIAIPVLALAALTNGSFATRALAVDPGSLRFGVAAAWVDRWILVPTLRCSSRGRASLWSRRVGACRD